MWRSRRYGPPYVVTGSTEADEAPGKMAKTGIRYRLSDIMAWVERRVVDPATAAKPAHLRVKIHKVTDAEWQAVCNRLKNPSREAARRVLVDALLSAAAAGMWPPQPAGARPWYLQLRKATQGNCWLMQAFEELGKFPGFPATIAVQTVIVYRRHKSRSFGHMAWRLRTDAHGALTARSIHATLDDVGTLPEPWPVKAPRE